MKIEETLASYGMKIINQEQWETNKKKAAKTLEDIETFGLGNPLAKEAEPFIRSALYELMARNRLLGISNLNLFNEKILGKMGNEEEKMNIEEIGNAYSIFKMVIIFRKDAKSCIDIFHHKEDVFQFLYENEKEAIKISEFLFPGYKLKKAFDPDCLFEFEGILDEKLERISQRIEKVEIGNKLFQQLKQAVCEDFLKVNETVKLQ